MALPKFDPWNATSHPGGRAYRAYGAYEESRSGTSGTLGTRQSALQSGQTISWVGTGSHFSQVSGHAIDEADELPANRGVERLFGPWLATLLNLGWTTGELRSLAATYGRCVSIEGNASASVRFATSRTIVFRGCSESWAYCRRDTTVSG